jgi:uncharacterized protein YbbC (DUF1343 family)
MRVSLASLTALLVGGLTAGVGGIATTREPAQPGRAGRVRPESPAAGSLDVAGFGRVDELVRGAIADRKLPGAVVVVGHRGRIVYERAVGRRAIVPEAEAMTPDTIFDLASLTKVVATTTAVMRLVEEGRLRLNDRVAAYVPGFERYGKRDITVQHLLTHTSGLRPDVDLADPWSGYERAIELAVEEVPLSRPEERFIYSDINFFLLADIVSRVSGEPFERYVETRIFGPLGMRDTTFNPPAALRPRIAPTEACSPLGWPCGGPDATMLRGTVHDPTARRMGGVAGHAGLFSTAADLARFCRMILGGGRLGPVRILSPLAVLRMTRPASPLREPNIRGLGWDIDSAFSANRGELFPSGSFGHTGFTGTSLWIDPATETFVIFLSNRLHPDGKGDVTPLRARVSTVVASLVAEAPAGAARVRFPERFPAASGSVRAEKREPVLTGIDVLQAEGFERLKGRRIGLLTNHTGRTRTYASTIDLLHQATGVTLVSLFSPEHGIRGLLDAAVPSSRDEKTGLPIHSLYGATRRPAPEMLDGLDTIVVDLQDVGARFYTYMTTMAYMMEEAAKRRIRVVVLDRPNPINGFQIEGPELDRSALGFTGYLPMPIRHGLTLGELARLFNDEAAIGADLVVVEARGWRRDAWFDETGLPWINPSPNMRNLIQASLYPGIGAIEGTNISVGRGTYTPFEQLGAPWIDGVRLAETLNGRAIPGVRFYPVMFTPASSKYAGVLCQGVFALVTDRMLLQPVRVGVEIAAALHRLYGPRFELESAERLLGSRDVITRIRSGADPADIAAGWASDEARWRSRRAKYLLYH